MSGRGDSNDPGRGAGRGGRGGRGGGRSGRKDRKEKKTQGLKPKQPQEQKGCKVVVRNLPIDYSMSAFQDFVDKMRPAATSSDPSIEDLGKKEEDSGVNGDEEKEKISEANDENMVEIQHLLEGEISRTKGSIPSVGFLKVKNEEIFYKLMEEFAKRHSSDGKDADLNPSMSLSPYHRLLKPQKKSFDKMIGTYEKDDMFKAFMEEEAAPVTKRESAEKMFQAATDSSASLIPIKCGTALE